jgi:hypothetical protein
LIRLDTVLSMYRWTPWCLARFFYPQKKKKKLGSFNSISAIQHGTTYIWCLSGSCQHLVVHGLLLVQVIASTNIDEKVQVLKSFFSCSCFDVQSTKKN